MWSSTQRGPFSRYTVCGNSSTVVLSRRYPPGVYFGKVFLRCGSLKQTEIVVHEGTHFVNTSMTEDNPNPTSPEGDARYRSQPAEHAIKNTHAYNLFAAQCVFGHPRRIAQEE